VRPVRYWSVNSVVCLYVCVRAGVHTFTRRFTRLKSDLRRFVCLKHSFELSVARSFFARKSVKNYVFGSRGTGALSWYLATDIGRRFRVFLIFLHFSPAVCLSDLRRCRDVASERFSRAMYFKFRLQLEHGYPLNLSILVSGGKETNEDFLSNGE
jgi:hypothetical protein